MKKYVPEALVAGILLAYSLYLAEWNANLAVGINVGVWAYVLITSFGRWLNNNKSAQ